MRYVDELARELVSEEVIEGRKFVFSPYGLRHVSNIRDSAGILAESVISIDGIPIDDIDEIREDIGKGMEAYEARRREILTWDCSLVRLIAASILSKVSETRPYDFGKKPFLRIYWKMVQMFGTAEVDGWGRLEWEWALYNYEKDLKDEHDRAEAEFERRKPWMNLDLYRAEVEHHRDEEAQEAENIRLSREYLRKNLGIDADVEIVEEEV